MKSFITLLFALSFFQGAVFAGNKVHFSVDAQKEVSNDTVIVQMVAQYQADTPSLVSKHINQQMRSAIEGLSQEVRPFIQTGQYTVAPRQDRAGKVTHWHGQQQLILTLPSRLPIADILQQLEAYLVYQSMTMALSPAVRSDVESDLLADALKIFQLQATAIAGHFGASRKHIIETHIQRSNLMPRPHVRMATMALDAAPVVDEGRQVITVSVSGVVELFDE